MEKKLINVNRQQTTPVNYPRSNRNHAVGKVTSVKPGVCAPLDVFQLFREDGIGGRKSLGGKWSSSRIGFQVEMAETKDIIMNKVRARFSAYVIPWLAFERFKGSRDEFDKSYAGEQGLAGQVIPFFEQQPYPASSPFYDALGLHGDVGEPSNTMYVEAQNVLWNFRAENRSPKITKRGRLDHSLPPAFWPAGRFEHLVSDFDDAVMDGQVALNVVEGKLPVQGLMYNGQNSASGTTKINAGGAGAGTSIVRQVYADPTQAPFGNVFAELQENGIAVSLANLEMAKHAQGFAKLRTKYEGHSDDYIIDRYLMDGIRIPDEAMKQPFLIAQQTVQFSQAGRYASNSGHLDEKAVSGYAQADLTLRVPTMNTGGIVIIIVEILPDQLFERQRDAFLFTTKVDELPRAMRDFADPEKVDIVLNGDIDTDHSDPGGLFGYAPLNWKWNSAGPGIGGKFKKPQAGGGTNVLRQRFWAHEEQDPALAESFYLCQGLTTSIFLDEITDPFEITATGNVVIGGLTQFGGALVEATENYQKVMEQMDTERVKDDA